MPINKKMPYGDIVSEVLHSYKEKGKIGNTRPKSKKKAIQIARAIAFDIKGKERKGK